MTGYELFAMATLLALLGLGVGGVRLMEWDFERRYGKIHADPKLPDRTRKT
jgi:hypothetical protein